MIVGVPRESFPGELRVALTPAVIPGLAKAGLEVVSVSYTHLDVYKRQGRMMHSLSGALTFQPYGKDETEVINSISRADLNAALMNEAEKRGVNIHFNERCLGFDLHSGTARFHNEETGRESTSEPGIVIAADGASSAIRLAMLKLSDFNLAQQHLDYGYKELTIAAGPDVKHVLETNALHIWPRGSHMLIALPNVCLLYTSRCV